MANTANKGEGNQVPPWFGRGVDDLRFPGPNRVLHFHTALTGVPRRTYRVRATRLGYTCRALGLGEEIHPSAVLSAAIKRAQAEQVARGEPVTHPRRDGYESLGLGLATTTRDGVRVTKRDPGIPVHTRFDHIKTIAHGLDWIILGGLQPSGDALLARDRPYLQVKGLEARIAFEGGMYRVSAVRDHVSFTDSDAGLSHAVGKAESFLTGRMRLRRNDPRLVCGVVVQTEGTTPTPPREAPLRTRRRRTRKQMAPSQMALPFVAATTVPAAPLPLVGEAPGADEKASGKAARKQVYGLCRALHAAMGSALPVLGKEGVRELIEKYPHLCDVLQKWV